MHGWMKRLIDDQSETPFSFFLLAARRPLHLHGGQQQQLAA
jgi:ABC-type arginine transport system ATPase subunit